MLPTRMGLHDIGTVPMEELVPADPHLYFRVVLPAPKPRSWWSRGRVHHERSQTFVVPRYGPLQKEPLLVGEDVTRGITRVLRTYGGVCFDPPLLHQLESVSRAGVHVVLTKVVQVLAEHLERLPPGSPRSNLI